MTATPTSNDAAAAEAATTTTATTASEDILQEALSSINFEFEGDEDSKPDMKPEMDTAASSSSTSSTGNAASKNAASGGQVPAPSGDTIFSPAFLTVTDHHHAGAAGVTPGGASNGAASR